MAPPSVSVVPARLERREGGVPFSAEFADVYHSVDGGLAQARHVFLGGNSLPARWRDRSSFTIVETGFGIGLNFLAAWHAWRADPTRPARLHFVSIENALFLDGFSPARNPAMWSPQVVRELARIAVPGATLATWTVAGGVRSALAD